MSIVGRSSIIQYEHDSESEVVCLQNLCTGSGGKKKKKQRTGSGQRQGRCRGGIRKRRRTIRLTKESNVVDSGEIDQMVQDKVQKLANHYSLVFGTTTTA